MEKGAAETCDAAVFAWRGCKIIAGKEAPRRDPPTSPWVRKGETTFAQFSSSGEFPSSRNLTAPDRGVRWSRNWDVPAGSRRSQEATEQGKMQTLLRLLGDFPFPPRVQLRVASFLQAGDFPPGPGPCYRMMRVGRLKLSMPRGPHLTAEPFFRVPAWFSGVSRRRDKVQQSFVMWPADPIDAILKSGLPNDGASVAR